MARALGRRGGARRRPASQRAHQPAMSTVGCKNESPATAIARRGPSPRRARVRTKAGGLGKATRREAMVAQGSREDCACSLPSLARAVAADAKS
jgi:hypothetical protein